MYKYFLVIFICFHTICFSQKTQSVSNKELSINTFDISKNGHMIAVIVSTLKETIIYDSFSGTELMRLQGYKNTPQSVYFDDINSNIIVEHSTKIDVWNSTKYQLIRSYDKPKLCISSYFSSESGKFIFLNENRISIYNINTGEIEKINRNNKDAFFYKQAVKLSKDGNTIFLQENNELKIFHKDKDYKKSTKIPFKNIVDFTVGNKTLVTLKSDVKYNALFQFLDLNGKPIHKGKKLDYSFVSYNDVDKMYQLNDDLIFFQSYINISTVGKNNSSYKFTFSKGMKNFKFIKGLGFGINYGKYLDFTDFEGSLMTRINVKSIYHSSAFVEENSDENSFLLNKNNIQFKGAKNKGLTKETLDSYYVNKFAKSGDLLAFATRDRKIRIWNTDSKKEVNIIQTNQPTYPQFLQISEKDKMIAALYQNQKKVVIIDITSNQIIKTISFSEESPKSLNLKNGWLAIGTSKGNYYTWKIEGSNITEELIKAKGLGNEISSVEIFKEEVYIASIGRILRVPLKKNTTLSNKLIKGHNSYIQAISIDSSGEYLVSSAIDGTVKLWDIEKETLLENYKTDAIWINQLNLFDNLKIVGNGPGSLGIVFKNEKLVENLHNPNPELIIQSSNTNSTRQLAFSPNGKLLASIDGSTIKVREIKTGFLISEFTTQNNAVNDIVFDKDGKSLIVATGAGIEFIDPITGKSKKYLHLKTQNRSIHYVEAFHERPVILGVNMHGWHYPIYYHSNSGKNLGQFNVNSGKEKDKLIIDLKISENDKRIATYGSHFIKIFSMDTEGKTKQLVAIPRKEVEVSSYWSNLLDFSDDSKYLAYVEFEGNNSTVIYDIDNRKVIYNETGNLAKFGDHHNVLLMTGGNVLTLKNLDDDKTKKFRPITDHQEVIMAMDYEKKNNLFTSSDKWGNIKIWDSKNAKTITELERFNNDIYNSEISPKGDFIAYNNKTGIYLFDLKQFKTTKLKGNNYPYFGAFSKDGNNFYFRDNRTYKVHNLKTKQTKKLFESVLNYEEAKGTQISQDGKLLMFEERGKNILHIYNLKSNSILPKINRAEIGDYTSVASIDFVDTKNIIFRAGGIKLEDDKKISIEPLEYNLKTKEVKVLSDKRYFDLEDNFKNFKIKENSVVNSFSPNGNLYAYQEDFRLKIKNLKTQKIEYDINPDGIDIQFGDFTPDGEFLVLAFDNGKIEIISTETFKLVKSFIGASNDVASVDIKGQFLMLLGADDKINVFDMKQNFKKLYAATFTGSGEFVIANKEGFYYASKGAINSIAFKKGTNVYPFEQFDLYYNRPDKAAENLVELGIIDSVLTKAYYYAYLKRIKKMGFNEDELSGDFNLPEVTINTNDIPVTVNKSNISIVVDAKDEIYNLDRINIWINDIPVFGSKGKSIKNLNTKQVSESVNLLLTNGDNKVQVSVTNVKGAESLKKTFKVNSNIIEEEPTLYLVSIGVSKYLNSEYDLKYAAKDAQDLSNYSKKLMDKYQKIETIELINENVTTENVIKVKEQLLKTKVSDVVIVFFAGHGLIDKNLDYYLATHDIDFKNPAKNGLSYENLEGLLDGIPARKKLLLMDSCHSGEIDKDELELINTEKSENKNITNRGTITASNKSKKMGLKNSFELMQLLFADLKRGTGAMVISSASGVEFAYEGEQWKNGVFTYALLEGLKTGNCDLNGDGNILVSEIREYVIDKVSELTNGNQNPTSRKENLEYDFSAW